MRYAITIMEKLSIKAHFLTLWRDTPEANITTFSLQLDRHQVDCKDHGVTVTNENKVDHFVSQMYACGLFEAKFMEDWEETSDKLWRATQPHFMQQFNKERRKLECENSQKHY